MIGKRVKNGHPPEELEQGLDRLDRHIERSKKLNEKARKMQRENQQVYKLTPSYVPPAVKPA